MKRVLFIIGLFLSSLCIYSQEYTIEEIRHDVLAVLNGSVQVYTADRVTTPTKEIQSVTPINRDSNSLGRWLCISGKSYQTII